jgi:predicted phage terminase large subunit-like protein
VIRVTAVVKNLGTASVERPALRRAPAVPRDLVLGKTQLRRSHHQDKASGTQLIQELIVDDCHGITRYKPVGDKIMRLHAKTATIENGFVHLPEAATWLAEYLHEMTVFPRGKHDDQVDSTAQFPRNDRLGRQKRCPGVTGERTEEAGASELARLDLIPGQRERDRKFADSPLEESGFELSVPPETR